MRPSAEEMAEYPLPRPLASHASGGPSLGHCLSRPVSWEMLSRLAPRQVGQPEAPSIFCCGTSPRAKAPTPIASSPLSNAPVQFFRKNKCLIMTIRLRRTSASVYCQKNPMLAGALLSKVQANELVLAAGEEQTMSQRGKRADFEGQDLRAGGRFESIRRCRCTNKQACFAHDQQVFPCQ